jgi:MFS-type transporter involved in bile tolerance (Atg22 family)
MKTVDVSDRVMKKVIGFEKRRTAIWLRSFAIIVTGFIAACITVFLLVVRDLLEKRAFDLFELFTQEREIIAEFWQEVLKTFWEELPQGMVFAILLIIIALVIFIFITRRKRKIIQKKLRQLEKYT